MILPAWRWLRARERKCSGSAGMKEVQQGAWVRDGNIVFRDGSGQREIMQVSEIPLKGAHNLENVLAAACAGTLMGCSAEKIRQAVRDFKAVEHRLEFVATIRGVDYYNDSKATNVDATIKALESFPANIHLILGGKDKGSDYTVLNDLLRQRVKRVYTIGAAAAKIESQIKGVPKLSTPKRWRTPSAKPMPSRSKAMWSCSLQPAPVSTNSRATSTAGRCSKKSCGRWPKHPSPPRTNRSRLLESARSFRLPGVYFCGMIRAFPPDNPIALPVSILGLVCLVTTAKYPAAMVEGGTMEWRISVLVLKPTRLRASVAVLASASMFLVLLAMIQTAQAQSFKVLHSFTDRPDGSEPFAGLIHDNAGNLYGTTYLGGTSGAGTVFKVNKAGGVTVLYNFTGGSDGGFPLGGLVRNAKGDLYGTTRSGGDLGNGSVFRLTGTKETVLHSFSVAPDGAGPAGGLVLDDAGNLYGTTLEGGAFASGIVFKIDKTGAETILYNFCSVGNCADGTTPSAGVIRDAAGNLYGTTVHGGAFGVEGNGTVFKLDTNGVETVLHSFSGGADGGMPQAALIRDSDGNLFGTTTFGGDLNCNPTLGCGTVFKLDTNLRETVLHAFTGRHDGALLFGSLVADAAQNLYGTAEINGAAGYGTVFRLSKSGKLTVLHSFNDQDGAFPQSGLLLDGTRIFGTTESGGDLNCNGGEGCGTVFALTL